MMWQDVPVQLVDLPPIAPEFFEPWVPSVIRSADAALLVVDLGSDDVADAALAVLDGWPRCTPSWWASSLTTWRTSGSGTSRR